MNRDEAKIILPFVTALAEGRQFQILDTNNGDWTNIVDEITADFFLSHNLNIRIKPEPTYRPFKDGAECLEEMQKHQPFGWIKSGNLLSNIISIGAGITVHNGISNCGYSFKSAFSMTFADGAPFGMKEE